MPRFSNRVVSGLRALEEQSRSQTRGDGSGSTPTGRKESLGHRDVFLLAVPGIWATTRIVFANVAGLPHLERFLVVAVLLWLAGVGASRLILAFGAPLKPTVFTTFIVLVCLVSFGPVSRQFGSLEAWGALIGLALATVWMSLTFEDVFVVEALVTGVSVFLLSGPFLIAVDTWSDYGTNTLGDVEVLSASMTERPDIWLVVLDGYPGRITLEADYGVESGDQLATHLEEAGFQSPQSAWTP